MESLIERGPMTVVLVFSPSCPHCHTYMPLWKKLERQRSRKSNMISVRADIYDKTPMSEKKPVSSVPTVLFVDKNGQISEASEPRNMAVMSNAVRTGSSEAEAAMNVATEANTRANTRMTDDQELLEAVRAATPAPPATPKSAPIKPILPGTQVSDNPLPAIPATPISEATDEPLSVQVGGNPWAAFLAAGRAAGPAAMLLGAYAALPAKRSSGLGRPSRSRSAGRR